MRVAIGELADLGDGLGVHLALHLEISPAPSMSSIVNCRKDSQPVGSEIGLPGASAKRRLMTSTWSPRRWSKPTAVRTRAAMRSISSLVRA
jgi:hypothetical protein